MINKFVSCGDCIYGESCNQFDPFFGCNNGKSINNNEINENENNFSFTNLKNIAKLNETTE